MTEGGRLWKGYRVMFILPVLVCGAGMAMLWVFWFREYRRMGFGQISAFCELMLKQDPELELQVLSAMKEYQSMTGTEIAGNTFLSQYGYRSGEWLVSDGSFLSFPALALATFAVLLFVIFFSFLGIWTYADRQKKKRIEELTAYLERVNAGGDHTVMQMEEDAFSHLQDELYKTVTELYQTRESALKARNNFADNLANIAHQLKTPITASLLSLQLMEQTAPGPYGRRMRRQLERLGYLEESLLTLSKIDGGTLKLNHETVDIYTALNLAAENLSDLFGKSQISISIPDRGCVMMDGDLEWTMEALMNLMKNCMEHSPRGGTIHCDYSANPLYVEISVWDEGEGFCPEDIPHLFERFYRGRRAGGEGIGIGLSLARSIFQLQNGNVTARNLPSGGACFEVRVYSH